MTAREKWRKAVKKIIAQNKIKKNMINSLSNSTTKKHSGDLMSASPRALNSNDEIDHKTVVLVLMRLPSVLKEKPTYNALLVRSKSVEKFVLEDEKDNLPIQLKKNNRFITSAQLSQQNGSEKEIYSLEQVDNATDKRKLKEKIDLRRSRKVLNQKMKKSNENSSSSSTCSTGSNCSVTSNVSASTHVSSENISSNDVSSCFTSPSMSKSASIDCIDMQLDHNIQCLILGKLMLMLISMHIWTRSNSGDSDSIDIYAH